MGLGSALGEQVRGNADIARRLGVDEEWITRRTGIHERRTSRDGVTALATLAGAAALQDSGVAAAEIELVLVATVSAEMRSPAVSPVVATRLGALSAGAMDINAACSGFIGALLVAASLIEAGRARHVLVIGGDTVSQFADPDDRRCAALFGDGAGAVVLGLAAGESAVGKVVLGADGGEPYPITITAGPARITMDGETTFERAVQEMSRACTSAAQLSGMTVHDADLIVLHQANGRILAAVTRSLGLDPSRVVDDIGHVGNTGAASIPLALDAARRSGQLRPGMRVLLGAFGAGLTWAGAVVHWDPA